MVKMWWPFNRDKYGESARELELSEVDKLNPCTDLTLAKALILRMMPEKTHTKEFCSERKLKTELAIHAFCNEICPIVDPDYKQMSIYSVGYDESKNKWSARMDYLGDEDDSAKVKYGSADEAFAVLLKDIDTTAVMKACEPIHLFSERDFSKHGMYKAHRGVSKALKSFEESGVEISRKDRKALRQCVNGLEPLLGTWFDNDAWPGQFFDGQKIDEDKSLWTKGFFDLPHLIEYTSALNDEQRQTLKERFFLKYNEAVDNFNSYVKSCNADTKGTVLKLMDKYLDNTSRTVTKIRKKILGKDPKTFEQYLNLLNRKELNGNIYVIDSHLKNLVEREHLSWSNFEIMYQSGKMLRCMSSFANHNEKSKKNSIDTLDGLYDRIASEDQLQKAITAAGKLKDYTVRVPELNDNLAKVESILNNAYSQMYCSKNEKKNDTPVAQPSEPEYSLFSRAA